ncbi:MAG: hypothetical protein S4CHLAM102_06070 [Chlamydiia bacterium]|nr:hypothetical protein [Chlamydiia bacterium]
MIRLEHYLSFLRTSSLIFALLFGQMAFAVSNDSLNDFYQEYMEEARSKVPGIAGSDGDPTGRTQFVQQGFMLWDYMVGVDTAAECATHFEALTNLCTYNKITRLIIFIKDPSTFTFYQPDDTSSNSFRTLLAALVTSMATVVSDFEVSVFFETGAFSSNAATGTAPTVNPVPANYSGAPSGYFADIQAMLDWSKAMIGNISAIKEIAFDPEASGANKNYQQLVYNYSDEYKYLNSLSSTRIGSTLGVDEAKETYANVSTFPVNSIYTGSISTFPSGSTGPSWRSSNNASLLQSVYIQCYQTSIPALFALGYNSTHGTGSHNGSGAAGYFNALLRDTWYLNGNGTVKATRHNTTLLGQSTNFKTFADALIFAQDPQIGRINKIGYVSVTPPQSDTSLVLGGAGSAFSTSGFVPFKRTEIISGWQTQPVLTQAMLDSIYWMFSANYQSPFFFFGNWQLVDFMEFITYLVQINNTATTAAFKENGSGAPLNFPSGNFVLYEVSFVDDSSSIVNTVPTSSNGPAPWNLQLAP